MTRSGWDLIGIYFQVSLSENDKVKGGRWKAMGGKRGRKGGLSSGHGVSVDD